MEALSQACKGLVPDHITLQVGGEKKEVPLDELKPELLEHLLLNKTFSQATEDNLTQHCRLLIQKIGMLNLMMHTIDNAAKAQLGAQYAALQHIKYEQEGANDLIESLAESLEKILLVQTVRKKEEKKTPPPFGMYT